MKNSFRQIIVLLSVLGTIAINILADVIPFNNVSTAAISDSFHVYFVPAGYVFSIWGIIYIGLIAYAIFQALPSQKDNPRLQSISWWVVLSGFANCAWIFLWHYRLFVATLAAMLVLLVSLILVYLRLHPGKEAVTSREKWAVRLPFSIYLGWVTVAAVANVTAVLDSVNWNGFGLSAAAWMVIVLSAVVLIGALMNFRRRDIAYAAVLLWALGGIAAKFPAEGIVTTATWAAFILVAGTLFAALVLNRQRAV